MPRGLLVKDLADKKAEQDKILVMADPDMLNEKGGSYNVMWELEEAMGHGW